jgi:hypothetical protein
MAPVGILAEGGHPFWTKAATCSGDVGHVFWGSRPPVLAMSATFAGC